MLKFATYNVNSIRSRLPIVTKWLAEHSPDVLCMQETKVQDAEFPAKEFRELGYTVVFHGQKSYNGVAIASKTTPESVTLGFGDGAEDEEARLIRARISGIDILNSYVPQGTAVDSPRFQYKLTWLRRMRGLLEREYSPERLLILTGDFNVAPEPADVYDPVRLDGSVCFHPAEREALREVFAWGLVDVFRMHHHEGGQYTFWDYFRGSFGRNRGWRLDHIAATRPLAARCTACSIDKTPRAAEKPSDHTVLEADFDL